LQVGAFDRSTSNLRRWHKVG